MPRLSASQRARLPDSAFAYIDSRGRRRLPINDEAHVRAALSRFEQVPFEDDEARERARKKLLNAAKKHGIVPVGFITGQLKSERRLAQGEVQARSSDVATLPTGFVTFLLTDIEESTALLRQLGDRYADVLNGVRGVVRQAVLAAKGREVDARADEFFAVFEGAAPAIEAAVALQRALSQRAWPDDVQCRLRVGIHSGQPTLTDTGYIGLSVHTAARVCWAAHGAQIVVSGETKAAIQGVLPDGINLRSLGRHRLSGLTDAQALFQVEAEGLLGEFPPPRTGGTSSTEPDP
ncbi:MAG TPA: adenylate/guanylate cyclase domain-containing protein [Actinomycetota bacterium]